MTDACFRVTRRRPRGGACLLTVLAAGGLAGAASGDARLSPAGAAADPPPHLHALPRRVSAAAAVPAARAKVAGRAILLYDLDGNGSYLDHGVDAWRMDDDDLPYAFPVEPAIVLDGLLTALTVGSEEGTLAFEQHELEWPELPPFPGKNARAELRKAQKEILAALATWNGLRMRNGLPPVHLDPQLTAACQQHALYMERWGVRHAEDPEDEGYTPEGDRVGRSGSVGSLPASDEIVEVYSTFYHRISLFHPDTRGAGIGTTGSRSCFNGTEGRERRPWTWPVVIPAPGSTEVPRTYHSEKPVPHLNDFRDGVIDGGGFPITLTFERDDVTDVVASLRAGGVDGAEIPFGLSWPERPASSDAPTNYKSICLLPHAALRPGTTYWVHVEWTYRGEIDQRTWTFRTGR